MNTIQLSLSVAQEEKLVAASQQFFEELEGTGLPFPKPSTLQELKATLLDTLKAQTDFEKQWLQSGLNHNVNALQIVHPDNHIRNLPWQLAMESNADVAVVKSKTTELLKHTKSQSYPLKVLIMVAAPEGVTRLDYEKEELQLLTAFSPLMSKGLVEIHFTEDGSLENLEEKLLENKYHILHFSGHGIFDQKAQVGKLALEEALTGKLQLTAAADLNEVFKKAHRKGNRPDLVLLSACQTAQGTTGDVTGVADTLLEGGIPAVLAMSASILDNCASLFAAQLYEQLSNEYELPYAFQQARLALRAFEIQAFQLVQRHLAPGQWLIPQLLLSQEVERLVDKNAPRTELDFSKNLAVVQGDKGLLELRVRPKNYVFVGRRKEKRAGFNALKTGKTVLLRGQGGVGKTALAEHLAVRWMVQRPKTKVFTHSEKAPAAESLLQQMTTYLTKEHKQFKVVSELAVIDRLTDKFLYLLGAVSQYCDPFFIFDNVESFQAYDQERQAWVWNINQHEDVFTLLQLLDQYADFPMVVTTRYPIAEFPDWQQVDMNTAPFGDFFKKCTQLSFYELAQQLEKDKISFSPTKKEGKGSTSFKAMVQLLYDTLGGNYRALEFFDEAYQKDKAGIAQLLQQLDQLRDYTKSKDAQVLQRMGENLIFEQLLSYLDATDKDVLSLLTHFNIPVLPMAIGFQRTGLNPKTALQKLTQLTLVEKQQGTDNRQRYYVIPLVKELLQQVGFEQTTFEALQAGEYHEYVENEDLELDTLSEIGEAFEYYHQSQAVAAINRVGYRLNNSYYQVQQFRLSLVYGLRTEEIAKGQTDNKIWNNIGQTLQIFGQLDPALDYLKKTLADYQKQNDIQSEGVLLNNISQIYYAKGDYDTALRYLEQSLKIQQDIGDRQGEGTTVNNLAKTAHAKGDYDKALRYLGHSLKIQQDIGDRQGEGTTLNNISQIYSAKGDYDTALRYLGHSLKIQQDIGDRQGEGTTLNNISQIYSAKGDYDKALRYLDQSLKIQQDIGDRQGEGTTLNNISQIYDAKGDYDKALSYLEQSLKIQQDIGVRKGEGATLNNISQIYYAKGDYDTALRYLDQSLKIQQDIGDRQGKGTTLNNIGLANHKKGNIDKALHFYEQSLKIRQDIGDTSGMATTLHNMGTISFNQQQYEAAIPPLFQAYQILERIGSPNKEHPAWYLNTIREKIGEERFQVILAEL